MTDLRATLLQRLADPQAIPILLRHAIPVIGVFVFDWSVLEAVAALLLDALSSLWMVGALGSYFAAKEFDHGETGVIATLQFWAGVFGVFLVIAGVLSMFVIVPAMFVLPLAGNADLDPWTLIESGWLLRGFGLMLACQLPGLVQRVRVLQTAGTRPEKMGMDTEVGFIAHRTVMLAMMASMLVILGPYALHVLVIVAQAFGAATEIMRDHYVGYLMAGRAPGRATSAASRPRRKRRR